MATALTEIKVTPEIAAEHGVTAEEYARIQKILGRDPNITELGIFFRDVERALLLQIEQSPSQAPSHAAANSSYKAPAKMPASWTSATALSQHSKSNRTITRATSSHSRARPTGVGGILRDIFTMGARPIAVLDSLRFGEITPNKNTSPEDAAKNRRNSRRRHPRVGNYGNCFGVPTVGGEVSFEPCYSQKSARQRARARHRAQGRDFSRESQGHRQSRDLRRGKNRPRRHSRRVTPRLR